MTLKLFLFPSLCGFSVGIIARCNSTPVPNGYALSMMHLLPQAGDIQLTAGLCGIKELITALAENC
jgi:hypothetical protein